MARAARNATIEGTTFTTIFQANTAGGSDGNPAGEVYFRVASASAKALRVYVDAEHGTNANYATIEIGQWLPFRSKDNGITMIQVAAEDAGVATYSWSVIGT